MELDEMKLDERVESDNEVGLDKYIVRAIGLSNLSLDKGLISSYSEIQRLKNNYSSELDNIDVSGVSPMSNVVEESALISDLQPLREDVVDNNTTQDELFSNASTIKKSENGNFFII